MSNLSLDDRNNEAQLLNDIIFKASSNNINVQLEGIKKVKSVASRELNPPIDKLVALGIIPILVDCLKKENEELELEAVSTLAIIASKSPEWAEDIDAAAAVPGLVKLLSSPSESLRERVVLTLAHMIEDGSESADECLLQRVFDHVVKSVTPVSSSSYIKCVSQFVFNWYEIEDYCQETLEILLPVVSFLLTREDVDTLFQSIRMIDKLADTGHIDPIIESGLIRQLVSFLIHVEDKLKALTLKVLINIAAGTDEQTQAVLDHGFLKYFPGLFLSKNENIVIDALWLLSNIAGGNQEQTQAVIDAGFIPNIINALDKGSNDKQRWAVEVIYSISAKRSTKQIMFLVDNGVIAPLCSVLTLTYNEILVTALYTIYNILKSINGHKTTVAKDIIRCGGLASIQKLEKDNNFRIHKIAFEIIDEFFKEKEEESYEEPMNFEENC